MFGSRSKKFLLRQNLAHTLFSSVGSQKLMVIDERLFENGTSTCKGRMCMSVFHVANMYVWGRGVPADIPNYPESSQAYGTHAC